MGIRSKGNPSSSFSDKSGNTGKEAAKPPHPGGVLATGGVKFQTPTSMSWASSRTVHFYTSPGTLNIAFGTSINVLVIGGGGGGGNASGGGGGAGGIAQAINVPTGIPAGGLDYDGQSVTANIYVGNGGAAGNNGSPSRFVYAPEANPSTPITITGLGGGAGGLDGPGSDGGSGGGAGYVPNVDQTGGAGNQPSQNSGLPFTVINYGTAGGDVPGLYFDEGGGGGGSENFPSNSNTKEGRQGEAFGYDFPVASRIPSPFMTSFPFFPSPLQSTLGPDWDDRTGGIYARLGGGGGGGKAAPNLITRDGGPGGGGDGGADSDNGLPGYNYTGGGGGGGGTNGGSGGSGGTGIVIVYY